MKSKKLLVWEIVATLLFLVGFFLVRFALKAAEINIGGETMAVFLAVAIFLVAIMIYLSGAETRFLSFSFDALVLSVAGFFLWELRDIESYALWFSLVVFATFVIISVVNTIKVIRVAPKDRAEQVSLFDAHSLITYGLATKAVVMGLGVVVVEKLLLPIFV